MSDELRQHRDWIAARRADGGRLEAGDPGTYLDINNKPRRKLGKVLSSAWGMFEDDGPPKGVLPPGAFGDVFDRPKDLRREDEIAMLAANGDLAPGMPVVPNIRGYGQPKEGSPVGDLIAQGRETVDRTYGGMSSPEGGGMSMEEAELVPSLPPRPPAGAARGDEIPPGELLERSINAGITPEQGMDFKGPGSLLPAQNRLEADDWELGGREGRIQAADPWYEKMWDTVWDTFDPHSQTGRALMSASFALMGGSPGNSGANVGRAGQMFLKTYQDFDDRQRQTELDDAKAAHQERTFQLAALGEDRQQRHETRQGWKALVDAQLADKNYKLDVTADNRAEREFRHKLNNPSPDLLRMSDGEGRQKYMMAKEYADSLPLGSQKKRALNDYLRTVKKNAALITHKDFNSIYLSITKKNPTTVKQQADQRKPKIHVEGQGWLDVQPSETAPAWDAPQGAPAMEGPMEGPQGPEPEAEPDTSQEDIGVLFDRESARIKKQGISERIVTTLSGDAEFIRADYIKQIQEVSTALHQMGVEYGGNTQFLAALAAKVLLDEFKIGPPEA